MRKQVLSLLLAVAVLLNASGSIAFAQEDNLGVGSSGSTVGQSSIFDEVDSTVEVVNVGTTVTTSPTVSFALLGNAGVPLKAGNHERWIDRLDLSGAVDNDGNYAQRLYDALIEAVNNDGTNNWLIDPTRATRSTASGADYRYYSAAIFSGEKAVVEEAAANASIYARAVFDAVDRDRPEIFWLTGQTMILQTTRTGTSNGQLIAEVQLVISGDKVPNGNNGFTAFDMRQANYQDPIALKNAIQKRDNRVTTILGTVNGATRYEKVQQLNHWLTANNSYNSGAVDDNTAQTNPGPWECLSALIGSTGESGPVCEGYARALKVLCDVLGIPCVLVDGHATNSANTKGEPHMWNYIEMDDGRWYAVDVTWNDPVALGNSQAASGHETDSYLAVGSQTVPKGETVTFIGSHPVTNKASTGADATAFINGPELNPTAYDPNAQVPTPPTVYSVTVSANGNGTATANPTTATAGTRITLTATPDSGYRFQRWEVTSGGAILANANSPTTTFRMPASDVSITAYFVFDPSTLPNPTTPLDFTNVGFGPNQTTPAGRGYSWDASTNTLTLTNLKLNIPGGSADVPSIKLPAEATVVLVGTNTITGPGTGIGGANKLTIQGAGTLTVTSANNDGIVAVDSVDVSGANVIVTSNKGTNSRGISAANVSIQNANVRVQASQGQGISATNVDISGNSVVNTTGATGISASNNVIISGGKVTSSGQIAGISAANTFDMSGGQVTTSGQNGIAANSVSITGGAYRASGSNGAAGIAATQSLTIAEGLLPKGYQVVGTAIQDAKGNIVTNVSWGFSSGGSGNSHHVDNYNLWQDVRVQVEGAAQGTTITVNAYGYDEMSESVMKALRENPSVSLVINWSGGDKITIPAGKALPVDPARIYYPLAELAGIQTFTSTSASNANANVGSITNPTTGGIQEVLSPDTPVSSDTLADQDVMTQETSPETEEALVTDKLIDQSAQPASPEESPSVTANATTSEKGTNYALIIAVIAVALVLVGGFFWINRQKHFVE